MNKTPRPYSHGSKASSLALSNAPDKRVLKFIGVKTALVNTDVRGRSFAPAGKTPMAMTVGGTRQKLSMIATVTNQGKTRWMIIDDSFDADKLVEFLAALIKDAGRKVFLILDNLRVHHSKIVKAWASERKDQIELFYLPNRAGAIRRRFGAQNSSMNIIIQRFLM